MFRDFFAGRQLETKLKSSKLDTKSTITNAASPCIQRFFVYCMNKYTYIYYVLYIYSLCTILKIHSMFVWSFAFREVNKNPSCQGHVHLAKEGSTPPTHLVIQAPTVLRLCPCGVFPARMVGFRWLCLYFIMIDLYFLQWFAC